MEAFVFFVFFGLYICIRVLFGGSESAWERQKKMHIHGMQLYRNQHIEEARFYFESAHKRKPFEALPLVILGEIALQDQKPELALAYGQKALRVDNGVAEAHLLMSKGLHAIGEYDEALKNAKTAAWFGRNLEEANWWYASQLLAHGRVDESITYLEIACKQGSQSSWIQAIKEKFIKSLPG